MFRIQIRNLQKRGVNLKLLRRAVLQTLKEKLTRGKDVEVSVVLVDNARIEELNRKFRGVKGPTDVLAFPLGGEFISTQNLLGEVIISVEAAEEQVGRRRHSLNDELALLVIHGILHLFGYSDESKEEREIMEGEERRVLGSLGMSAEII